MRSICRAGKLWVEQGVGASVATDLALRNPSRLLAAYANRLLSERILTHFKAGFRQGRWKPIQFYYKSDHCCPV